MAYPARTDATRVLHLLATELREQAHAIPAHVAERLEYLTSLAMRVANGDAGSPPVCRPAPDSGAVVIPFRSRR